MDNTFTPGMIRDRMLEEQEANAKAAEMARHAREQSPGQPEPCRHEWVALSTHGRRENYGGYSYCVKYTRTDVFFCRHCLEQQDKTRTATVNRDEPAPIWYDSK